MPLPTPHSAAPAAADTALPPNLFFSTTAQRVGLARQRFFDEGQRPSGLVSDVVIQSWTRCNQAARAVGEALSFNPVTRSRIDSAISRNRMLLEAGHKDLLQLQDMLAGTGCKVILTDARGIVVHVSPAQAGESRLMELAGRVGVDLSEHCVGTTAPGVVLLSGHSCTVRGAEHYFQVNHGMHCAAAPIRDVRGELAAVLDLSCEGREFQFDAAALAGLYASAIENRLLIRQSRPFVLLRFQADPQLLFTPMEGLAAIDEAGQLLWTNAAGRSLLQAPQAPQAPRHAAGAEQLFGLKLAELVAAARSGQWQWHGLPNGLRLCVLVQAEAAATRTVVALGGSPAEAPAAAPATAEAHAQPRLRTASQQLIEQTLAACGGNVSRAARQLGVSRGLIYRHLQPPADAG